MSQQPNSTHPELSMLYEIETDTQKYPFQCFDFGDMLWNVDPHHYNASKALSMPTKQKTVLPVSLFTVTMDVKRAWEMYISLPLNRQQIIDEYNIEVRLMIRNPAGYKWDETLLEWGTKDTDRILGWESWWNFMDTKYNNNHLYRLGPINAGYKVGDEKRTSPFENKLIKKRKFASETEPRRITPVGTAWIRTTIPRRPLEEKTKDGERNRNIYSTVKLSEKREKSRELADLGENSYNITGNSCVVGAKLCYYWIKHENGCPYLEQYCEPYEGKLSFTTGDIKYSHFTFGGIILEANNPSSKNYSLNQRLLDKTEFVTDEHTGIITLNKMQDLHWNQEHEQFYTYAKQMKVIHPIQTNYCLNENSRTTSMGLIMNDKTQNPYEYSYLFIAEKPK